MQFAPSIDPPESCPICEDVRQFVRWDGQAWTTLDEMRRTHAARLENDHGLLGISSKPGFAIGQRALLVPTADGNILWDCSALIDDEIVGRISEMGGLSAICISHCHYYTTMIEWSDAFGGVPIYLHEDNRKWVQRDSKAVVYWSGEEFEISGSATLLRVPGHFAGGTILHWPQGAGGAGALLSGDILQVTQDRLFVSFMYSYPNYIPVNAKTVTRIGEIIEPLAFDRIYGAFWQRVIDSDAKAASRASVERYLRAIS
ncbi:MBL fold metallo-hydrolase [Bradyrhizobium sp. LHD-71]|nr:MBL fold metallo-hydrolase [Bradyrhizobium sp. LHD-71]MDQ8727682.1 MBL fold metallo-hydrolase [Bradyrhizobium sp. LHD-71]